MEYTWDRKKITRYLKQAKSDDAIEIYSSLLALLDIKKEKEFDKSSILLLDSDFETDFIERMKIYITGLDYINDSLYSDITDMFYWFQDFDAISKEIEFDKFEISDKELVELVYEIIESINNKELLEAYKTLIDPTNHLLYIQSDDDKIKTDYEKLGGITIKGLRTKTSHVAVFRNNTVEDVEILLHETMHFLYNYLLYKRYKIKDIKFFTELEGQYGSIYAARYLEKINKQESIKLRCEQFNSILSSAFVCLVNSCLYQTSENKQFNLSAAEELINRDMKYGKVRILPEEVDIYTTVKGFETMTNIVSYLIALELNNEEIPNEALNYIYNIKFDDGTNILDVMEDYGIHFQEDGYQDLFKEYKLTHK